MHDRPCSEHDPIGHGAVVAERNRYFTGKSMAAREFITEQQYFLTHHWLHNRLLHGWGIVCGLAVVPHPVEECRDRWVVVKAGIAIDCHGRELILPKDTPVRFRPDPAREDPAKGARPWEPPDGGLLVALRYCEDWVEPVPLLYDEGGCDPDRSEYGRVREVAGTAVVPFDEVGDDCWLEPGGEGEPCRYADDCDEQVPGPALACIEPGCACGDLVPVARLLFEPGLRIDDEGVRRLPTPREYLTHITKINWEHGQKLSIRKLRDEFGGELRVHFDRPLRTNGGDATGINEFTFVVQYDSSHAGLEFIDSQEPPRFVQDETGCYAVFPIDDDHLDPRRKIYIGDRRLFVTLECDFILDCHGNPVDGDHLRGRRPSGNGQPGGTFKSWFRVDRDDGYAGGAE